MHHRFKGFALGAAALAMIGVGTVGNHGVFAQEEPAAESTPAVGSAGDTDTTVAETSAYDNFIAGLAEYLGISDPATVDSAIKTVLKEKVDEQLAAGEISDDEATARKDRIDAGEFGDFGGFSLGFGQGHEGRNGGQGNGAVGGPRGGRHPEPGNGDHSKTDDGSNSGTDAPAEPTETPIQSS